MESNRTGKYVLLGEAQKSVLVSYFKDGMTSTLENEKISRAAEETGLTEQRVKKWIGNQRAKEKKRASHNVPDEDYTYSKRIKGERKVAARSLFYRHLSKEGKLVGFKNNAERNVYFANEWEKVDEATRKELEAEAERINENRSNEMSEEEINGMIKLHKKKLLKEISILESYGVDTTVIVVHGDQMTNFGSERGLAFLDAHPSFNMEFQRYYDMTENEKQYTYKDLQLLFNRAYAKAIRCENARVPYLKGNFMIEGLPENVAWKKADGSVKKPTDYGQKQINEIMANRDRIHFVISSAVEAENGAAEAREQPSVPTCLLKLVSTEVAERALSEGAQISAEEIDQFVQMREDETDILLKEFGHFFTEDAKNAILSNNSFVKGFIFPVYTEKKRQFWLFYYAGTLEEIDNAPLEATIPGKWLNHTRGRNYEVLHEAVTIKRVNIICDRYGGLLSLHQNLQNVSGIVEIKAEFLKTIKDILKFM